jgi:alpha-ketoglutarate-dependent taurine dioxygenase
MIGSFLERESDPHVASRRALIEEPNVLPAPDVPVVMARAANVLGPAVDALVASVAEHGLGVLQLDEPLSNSRFCELGTLFGNAMPETDPAVLPQVEGDVVLNLISAHGHTSDVSRQPFGTNALSLHTEGSGRATAEQPRYIILMCCNPGGDATAAQTVLVPMATVHDRLPADVAQLLSRTRYRTTHDVPWLLRQEAGRPVFSFRDFQQQTLEWELDGMADPEAVSDAIRQLLRAIYTRAGVSGVHWRRSAVVVLDNRYFFHGRVAGAVEPLGEPRHLKRLRIAGSVP